MPYSVFLLQLITKNDLEDTPRLTGDVLKLIQRWCKPGMHAKRNIAFVIVSDETLQDLAARLWGALQEMKELGRIERFFLTAAPDEVISDHGNIDPLRHWIGLGRVEAGQRSKPQDMRKGQGRHRRIGDSVHHFKRSAVR